MALNDYILTLLLTVPLAGAFVVWLLPQKGKVIQGFTLLVTLLTLAMTLHLPAHFDAARTGFQYEQKLPWIESLGINYHVGVDGLSLWLVVLTGLLAPIGVLASWNAIQKREKQFYALFLVQQTAMIGVFVSLDLILYYGFWELSLIPMAALIAMHGDKHGGKAALKFFTYTFIPSAPLLVAILWLYGQTRTFDYETLRAAIATQSFSSCSLYWVALAFLFAFAVKVPVFPLHGWLADTFVEAPTALAMVVAGKLGLYSMLRFHIGLFPQQARAAAPWVVGLAVIGLLYGACMALAQRDMKRLLAFSTVSHLSFCTLGLYSFVLLAADGGVYQILNHGISGAAIFVLMGVLYERYGSYEINHYGGLAGKLPWLATFFVVTSLSLVGLPMLNGFIGEFLVLSGSFPAYPRWVAAATLGVILSAAYMLWLVQRIFYGKENKQLPSAPDLGLREHLILWPLAALMLVMGVATHAWLPAIHSANETTYGSSTTGNGGAR